MSQQTLENHIRKATISSFNSNPKVPIRFRTHKGLIELLLEFMKMHYELLTISKCNKVKITIDTYTEKNNEHLKLTMLIIASTDKDPYIIFKSSLDKKDWNKNMSINHEE
jgi:hypothetical protein